MPLYKVYLQIETCLTCLHEKQNKAVDLITGYKHVAYHVGTCRIKAQVHNRLYLWLSCVADGKYNNNIVRARTQELRTNYGLLVVA